MLPKWYVLFIDLRSVFIGGDCIIWRHSVRVASAAKLHLLNSLCVKSCLFMSAICNGENLWQCSLLKVRLNTFCGSTIPQKQFIIFDAYWPQTKPVFRMATTFTSSFCIMEFLALIRVFVSSKVYLCLQKSCHDLIALKGKHCKWQVLGISEIMWFLHNLYISTYLSLYLSIYLYLSTINISMYLLIAFRTHSNI